MTNIVASRLSVAAGVQCFRRFLGEALLFAMLPTLFLISYVGQFRAPTSAIVPHVQIMLLLWGSLLLIRMTLASFLGRLQLRLVSSFLITLAVFGMLLYYSLVLVGLGSWGRVVSKQLIVTYASQLPSLCEVLGVSPAIAAIVVGGSFLLAWWAVCSCLRVGDWIALLFQHIARRVSILLTLGAAMVLFVSTLAFFQVLPAYAQEPISLTLEPDAGQTQLQHHDVSLFEVLDGVEDKIRKEYVPNPSAVRRNVFVIVVDALRADHLGFNGYQRSTSPFLDSMARGSGSERPWRMYSACAESACGLMALSSSRYPYQFTRRPMTLPQVLALHGYRTHMILGGDHTNFYGLREAYGKVDTYYDGSMAKGWYMNDDGLVMAKLAEFPDWQGAPVFMQFHLMSAHGLGRRQAQFNRYQPAENVYAVLGTRASPKNAEANQEYINFYDNGVLQTDDMVRSILQVLQEKGYLKNSLVVITADHGELLGEHGRYSHAKTVYEPVLNVPFLMLRYGYTSDAHVSRTGVASQVDIAPTIVQELDIPKPASWVGLALQSGSVDVKSRRFIYFQQQSEYGLLDMGTPGVLLKYRADAHTHSESASDVFRSREELDDQLGSLPAGLKTEWVRQLLGIQAAASGNDSKLTTTSGLPGY